MANISNKKIRIQVYEKYDGHCAYCGRKIEYKDMQIDHLIPQRRKGSDDFSNLMPTDRICNLYKRAFSLETFRRLIFEIPQKLQKLFIGKVGLQYGLVEFHEQPIKFYFEIYDAQQNIQGDLYNDKTR